MAIHWEQLFGDTGEIALRLALLEDPLPDPRQPREMAASWGRFSLYVRGRNLTRNEEAEGEIQEGVNWYLLPLLEWLVGNWNPIFHEERLPAPAPIARGPAATALEEAARWLAEEPEEHFDALDARWQWWRRHAMESCREGATFPRVALRRYQDDLEISWEQVDYGHRRFDSPPGAAHVEAARAALVFSGAIEACLAKLSEAVSDSARIRNLRRSYDGLRGAAEARSRMMWLSGFNGNGTSSLAGALVRRKTMRQAHLGSVPALLETEAIGNGDLVVPHAVPTLLFRSLAPKVSPDDLVSIRLAALACRDTPRASRWREHVIAEHAIEDKSPPWRQGYWYATRLRARLGVERESPIDIRACLEGLDVSVETISLRDSTIRAFCLRGPGYRPTVFLNETASTYPYAWATAMDLAHELAHLLLDGGTSRPVAVVSGPWAPLQLEQRANAFAAMFLLPEEAVRKHIGPRGSPVSSAGIRCLMNRYGVGATTTTWHMRNLGWIDEQEREVLLNELTALGDRSP